MASTVYIDDCGGKTYTIPYSRELVDNPPPPENFKFWEENYFVLCGIKIENEDLPDLNEKLNALKRRFFGSHAVEIKSTWMRIPMHRKTKYLDPYKIADNELNAFGEEYFNFIRANTKKIKIFAVVFDKRWYGAKRKTPDGNPLLKSAQVIFERINSYCGEGTVVVFDQMEKTLSVEKGSHGRIKKIHLKNEGMKNAYIDTYNNICNIEFKNSSSENFLQIADICAYTIARQFREHGGNEWAGGNKNENGSCELGLYEYFDKIRCNFFALKSWGFTKKVRGFGLVCVPDNKKISWDLLKGCNL